MAMHHAVAAATLPSATSDFVNRAIDIQAPAARTGCISGASNMAPITTAAEFKLSPITATTTERVIITTKR